MKNRFYWLLNWNPDACGRLDDVLVYNLRRQHSRKL